MLNLFLGLCLFLLIFSLFGLLVSIRPPRIHSPYQPHQFVSSYEDITLTTSDGLALKGWFIPQEKSDKAVIALHGYPADKSNILPGLLFLHKDFNLLFLDFRYFGSSEGSITTAGARETKDLAAALEFLRARGFKKIGVWGFSLGGSVALMSIAHSSAIKAIVAESAYAELSLMARETYRHLLFLKYPLGFLTGIWAKLLLGVDIDKASPVKGVRNSRSPILIIHSTTDQVIPFSHALRLKEALADNPKAEFWFREGLSHGQLGTEYEDRVRLFFQENL